MPDPASRIVELEVRLAFQEQALTELSDAVAGLRGENARLFLAVQRALDQLRDLRAGSGAHIGDVADERPPHY